jgi:hypothetical protein
MATKEIVDMISRDNDGSGVIVFPGGWFDSGKQMPNQIYRWVERNVRQILNQKGKKIIVTLGIDGRIGKFAKDQIGIAISPKGIEAIGRKFYPTKK